MRPAQDRPEPVAQPYQPPSGHVTHSSELSRIRSTGWAVFMKPIKLKLTMFVFSESKEQEYLFQWKIGIGIRRWPELRWLHAVPNGMAASSIYAAKAMRQQGMTKGIPDIFLPVARRGYHGLYIEMKRSNGRQSDLSPEQKECLMFLQQQGYQALVAFGWRDAVKMIEEYLE